MIYFAFINVKISVQFKSKSFFLLWKGKSVNEKWSFERGGERGRGRGGRMEERMRERYAY